VKRFAILQGAYRILLRSYPVSFRESHGTEMSRVFRQDCQEAWRRRGRLGVLLLSISTLVDLIRTAAGERLDGLDARNSRRGPPVPSTRSVQEMIADLLQDLRYGARSMLSRPAFTAVAVLTLAVGIGTNTAIFGVVDGALLRPLPYREPDRLLMLWQAKLQWGLTQLPTSLPQLLDWRQRGGPFEEMAGFSDRNVALTGRGEPEQLPGARATSDLFQVLGVEPLLGRTFLPEESQPDSAPVVVIGEELWRRLFHSDPAALGQSLVIDGVVHTIIGVAPRSFQLPEEDTALWMPIVPDARMLTRDTRFLSVVARLRRTNTIDEAQAFMDEVGRQEAIADPENSAGFSMRVVSLREQISGPIRSVLLLFMAAVGFVLLIACVNVANLLLSRGVARQRELAIRGAVGASRGRIIQQLLTESTLLALCGGVLGILLAQWGQNLLWAAEPGNLPRAARVGVDARVLGFTALVCGVTVLLYGLLPSLQVTGRSSGVLAGPTRGSTGPQGHRRIQRFLVVTEVALALMLSIGAALLLRTVASLQSVSLGFEPRGVLTGTCSPAFVSISSGNRRSRLLHPVCREDRGASWSRERRGGGGPPTDWLLHWKRRHRRASCHGGAGTESRDELGLAGLLRSHVVAPAPRCRHRSEEGPRRGNWRRFQPNRGGRILARHEEPHWPTRANRRRGGTLGHRRWNRWGRAAQESQGRDWPEGVPPDQ
jgi:putative ABC transport system permease protein